MPAWYELTANDKGQTSFVLKAANGEVVLRSETYESKASAKNGIASVQKNSPLAERYDRLESKNGKFYFNLKAGNHQIVGTSQMYATEKSRDDGIASVTKNGGTATVKDLTAE
jgi:hypothetical protein